MHPVSVNLPYYLKLEMLVIFELLTFDIFTTFIYPLVYLQSANTYSKWQREWENSTSKLKHIKPHNEEWQSFQNRCGQYEVKLSRFCIGHTRLTHRHFNVKKHIVWKTENHEQILLPEIPPIKG